MMTEKDEIMTVKDWLIMWGKSYIPFYNIYYLIVTAMGKNGTNKNLCYCMRASLIMGAISLGLAIVLAFMLAAIGMM